MQVRRITPIPVDRPAQIFITGVDAEADTSRGFKALLPQSSVSAYPHTMPDWSNPLEVVKDAGKFASLCLRHIPDTRMLRDCLHRLSCSLKSHHWAAWLSLVQFRDTREAHAGGVRVVHLGNNRPAPI